MRLALSYLDQRVAAAIATRDYTVEPTPQARNSQQYQNRPACCGSGTCIPICPVDAKYDAMVPPIARATPSSRDQARLLIEAGYAPEVR